MRRLKRRSRANALGAGDWQRIDQMLAGLCFLAARGRASAARVEELASRVEAFKAKTRELEAEAADLNRQLQELIAQVERS